ncbi:GNAT family N-acetyltransferase [Subtercola sp. YIM 133946]|uniref:GNAT family N-acetyltransferase n=1 Tax=Subtercola sp. YIM 133946 TaxID=3118909 RepID=UPI002F935D9C
MLIRPFNVADTEAVVALWTDCGLVRPWNDPHRDIARKLTVQPELFLVGVEPAPMPASAADDATVSGPADPAGVDAAGDAPSVIASAMVGYDGHRGWVNYLAVSPAAQRRGYARQLMAEAERLLTERGCPKLNLQVRSDNTEAQNFYRALGYEPDHAVAYGKRLIAD